MCFGRKPSDVRDQFMSWFQENGAKLIKKDFSEEELAAYDEEIGFHGFG